MIAVTAVASTLLVPVSAVKAESHGPMHDGTAGLRHAKGFPNARGAVAYHRDYDSHHAAMDEELHLLLRGVNKLAGKRVRVYVHGEFTGRARVNDDGRARLHRHSGLGEMHEGWGIRVRTRTGKLVAYASFDEHMDGHM